MAQKHRLLKTALCIAGGAAVGYLAYRKRELISNFFTALGAKESEPEYEPYEGNVIDFDAARSYPENDIVIDRTAGQAEAEAPEAAAEAPEAEDAAPEAACHAALRRGPVMLARDAAFGGDIRGAVTLSDHGGYAEAEPAEAPFPARQAWRIKTAGGSFPAADYASCGQDWTQEMTVWVTTA